MGKGMTAGEIADKQVERTRASVPYFERGVNAVTESPMAKAADNLDKAAENYRLAVSSGRMKKRLLAVSLPDWQAKTVAKSGRIPEGVEAARDRIADFHGQRMSHQDKIDVILKTMPTRTPSDMDARMLKQSQEMRKMQYIPTVA